MKKNSEPYKVLHYVAVMNRGGEETFIMNVFRAINREKIIFDFLCAINQPGDYDDEIYELNGKIYYLSTGKSKVPIIDRTLNIYNFFMQHSNEYDVFHIHTQHAMDGYLSALSAKKAGVYKVIVHSHSTNTQYHPTMHKLFQPLLEHLPIIKFACSDLAGKWLFGANTEYTIVYNGIDTNKFSFTEEIRTHVKQKNGWNDNIIIGHVGSFTYPKNHKFIVEVFNEIKKEKINSKLVLVGTGPLLNNIMKQIEQLGLKEDVYFLGNRSDINELVQGFDLFLFPSHYEGFPVVLVEAQSTGLKCLISDIITNEVNITPNIYKLSLDMDIKEWAKTAIELIDSGNYRYSMTDKIVASGLNIENTVKILEQFYCD